MGPRRLTSCVSLRELDVRGRKQASASVAASLPPALVDHLNVSDDVDGVEGDLVLILCRSEPIHPHRRADMIQKYELKVETNLLDSRKSRWLARRVTGPRSHLPLAHENKISKT